MLLILKSISMIINSVMKHNIRQKRALGIITAPQWEAIEIISPVEGVLSLWGDLGIDKEQVKILEENYPTLKTSIIHLQA